MTDGDTALAPVRLFDLEALPMTCRHAKAGQRHRSLKETYRCLARTGVPGFRLTEREF